MGLIDLFRKLFGLDKKETEFESLRRRLVFELDSILIEKNYLLKEDSLIKDDSFEDIIWVKKESKKFIIIGLFEVTSFDLAFDGADINDPRFNIEIIIGEGGFDYYEKKWNSINVGKFCQENEKVVIGFENLKEFELKLDQVKEMLIKGYNILDSEYELFILNRRKRAQETLASKISNFDKSTNQVTVENDDEDLKWKEFYSK